MKRVRRSIEEFSAEPGVGVSQQGWAGEESQPACMALARWQEDSRARGRTGGFLPCSKKPVESP